jgi:L-alanine-DL-glutamate epimerase-like enolase superfamily enzyme
MEALKRTLHVFGRSGPLRYALSGLDIALWDLAGKKAGLPLWRLLGGSPRVSIPAYASKLRLSEPRHVADACARAVEGGFKGIKLHEVTVEATAAARQAIGPEIALMLDVNCPWTFSEAFAIGRALQPYDLAWLEEPLWPPEDLENLGRLGRLLAMPLAAGENAANAWAFKALAQLDGLDILQPSITKCGGVTEFFQIGTLAGFNSRTLVPHSPYLGPGFLATLQMAAVFPQAPWVEYFSVELERPIFRDVGQPTAAGDVPIPQGPGLGADPDPEVLTRYRV